MVYNNGEKMTVDKPLTLRELQERAFGDGFISKQERNKKMIIKDIPVMKAEDGRIICFPWERRENLKIGIFGLTGAGKTRVLHSVQERIRWYGQMPSCILNDFLVETISWGARNIDEQRMLRVLNEISYPLPIVHVYPQNNETKIYSSKNIPHVRISVPFSKIIQNYKMYLKMKESTAKYFLQCTSELLKCEDWENVESVIDEQIGNVRDKMKQTKARLLDQTLEATKYSIMTSLNEAKNEGYIDIIARQEKFEGSGTPSVNLSIKKENGEIDEGPVFSMLMKYGFIPTLITTDLLHKRYAEPFLADRINEIFEFPKLYGKNCLVAIPEMKLFMKYPAVVEQIENITGRGRMRGVGLIYDTHNYLSIKREIRQNTVYALAFTQKEETANQMKKDFDLSEQDKVRIINLKKFECLAIASAGEPWVAYDYEGHRELVDDCIKGVAFPPLSMHQRPSLK